MNPFRLFFFAPVILLLVGCQSNKMEKVTLQHDFPPPPVASTRPVEFVEFGNKRIDPYFWLREKANPEVLAYLKAENAYCDTVMAGTKGLQEQLFLEMRGRIKEADESVPVFERGFFHYTRTLEGKQYPLHLWAKTVDKQGEEVLFDINAMAEGKPAYLFAGYSISDNNRLAAYAFNETGSFVSYSLKIKDLSTGQDLSDRLDNLQSFAWASDNKTLFYVIGDEALRGYRLYRHVIGSVQDELLYEEQDSLFSINVDRDKTGDYIILTSGSFSTSEVRFLEASKPLERFKVFVPRKKDVEYFVYPHVRDFYIQYKDRANLNGKVMKVSKADYADPSKWQEVIAHNPDQKLMGIDLFEKFLVSDYRVNPMTEIRVMNLLSGKTASIGFPEKVFSVQRGYTPDFTSSKLRYSYTSLNRPNSTFDFDMDRGTSQKLKEQEIPSGFDPEAYVVEQKWAEAADGVKIPMALVYRKGLSMDGSNPTLLYSYGSYGYSQDMRFRTHVFSLIDRGFVFAIAQIRGGSDMGEQWYEDGKLLKKKNTFTDFIACAEHLVKEKYTRPEHLVISGGSAGGLLVGACVNMRPDLFGVVVAQVPFVDVINTMLDESLPLTTQEYEEWGNPNEQTYYEYMLSYSPYDNVRKVNYPHMLVTAGLNDSQVGYHEPAKWVARLRGQKTDSNIILLKTNMDSGHGGATGRFDGLKELAFEYAFILDRLGISASGK